MCLLYEDNAAQVVNHVYCSNIKSDSLRMVCKCTSRDGKKDAMRIIYSNTAAQAPLAAAKHWSSKTLACW
jgi:hypothetical protein